MTRVEPEKRGRTRPGSRPGDGPAHKAARSFAPRVTAPAEARTFAVGAIRGWGIRSDHTELLDDVAFVVTELSTNAVIHARSTFTVRVAEFEETVRVSVEDGCDRPPQLETVSPKAETGRGLALTAELAEQWGYDPTPTGKIVWADLPHPLQSPPGRDKMR